MDVDGLGSLPTAPGLLPADCPRIKTALAHSLRLVDVVLLRPFPAGKKVMSEVKEKVKTKVKCDVKGILQLVLPGVIVL